LLLVKGITLDRYRPAARSKGRGVGWRNQDKMGAVDSTFGSVFMLYRVAIVAGLFAFAVISLR
jgi:hypothetical protein